MIELCFYFIDSKVFKNFLRKYLSIIKAELQDLNFKKFKKLNSSELETLVKIVKFFMILQMCK